MRASCPRRPLRAPQSCHRGPSPAVGRPRPAPLGLAGGSVGRRPVLACCVSAVHAPFTRVFPDPTRVASSDMTTTRGGNDQQARDCGGDRRGTRPPDGCAVSDRYGRNRIRYWLPKPQLLRGAHRRPELRLRPRPEFAHGLRARRDGAQVQRLACRRPPRTSRAGAPSAVRPS
jgi:hypothetical protein